MTGRRTIAVLGVVAALAAPALLAACAPDGTARSSASVDVPTSGGGAPPSVDEGLHARLQTLFDARAAAVRAHDAQAWAATTVSSAAGADGPGAVFTALTSVPFVTFRYEVTGVAMSASGRDAATGSDEAGIAHILLTYRLAADPADVRRNQEVPVVRRGSRWLVAATGTTGTSGTGTSGTGTSGTGTSGTGTSGTGTSGTGGSATDLWDAGPVAVARGARSLVLGSTREPANDAASVRDRLTALARQVDDAARRVDAVWGEDWPRTVVVLVPGSLEQTAALLGRTASSGPAFGGLDQLAAVTVTAAGAATVAVGGARRGADRVVVNPEAFAGLTPAGRLVVLTHELTHIATHGSPVSPPLWLQEGFAEYVGYQGSGLGAAQIAADALDAARVQGAPTALPDDAAFDAAHGDVAARYAQAWVACALVVRDAGLPRLVALYRAASSDRFGPDPGAAVDGAFTTVLGLTRAQFEQRWSQYLAQLASTAR